VQQQARILVVDDDPDVVELLSLVLQSAGYQVATALNGRQALRECSRGDADLVILDIMMPGLSGLAVLRGMRRICGRGVPPVIAFSGFPNLIDEAVRRGARKTLQKPCDIDRLLAVVRDTLEH